MLLRVLTIVAVIIGIAFIGYSFLVMTGGREWLVASTTESAPKKVAAKDEKPHDAEAKPAEAELAVSDEAEAEPDEAKPAESMTDGAMDGEAKEADAQGEAADDAAAEGGAPATTNTAGDEGEAEKPAEGGDGAAGVDPAGNPAETAKAAEKGSLKSPYQDSFKEVAEEGHKKFMAAGCNGCHGGTGGGGMGPPLSNEVWVYGNDGDTLFRLIALGSDGLKEQGYVRKGSENVVGPMPPHGNIVKSNDDMWKIIGWIWSINPPS